MAIFYGLVQNSNCIEGVCLAAHQVSLRPLGSV